MTSLGKLPSGMTDTYCQGFLVVTNSSSSSQVMRIWDWFVSCIGSASGSKWQICEWQDASNYNWWSADVRADKASSGSIAPVLPGVQRASSLSIHLDGMGKHSQTGNCRLRVLVKTNVNNSNHSHTILHLWRGAKKRKKNGEITSPLCIRMIIWLPISSHYILP